MDKSDLDYVWDEINKTWGDLQNQLKEKLPVHEHLMFDNSGQLVSSERPMLESIVCDKIDRLERFFFYLFAADIIKLPEATSQIVEIPGKGREIYISSFSGLSLGSGGKRRDQ